MRITPAPEVDKALLERLDDDRPKGEKPSLTELLFCLIKAYYRRRLPANERRNTPDSIIRMSFGRAAHSMFGQTEPEYERDGIVCHPDILYNGTPWELKTTRFSGKLSLWENEGAEKMKPFIDQLCGQCAILGTTQGFISPLHVITAHLKSARVEFADDEIREMMDSLRHRRNVLLSCLLKETRPAFEEGVAPAYNWECGRCDIRAAGYCEGAP